MRSRPSLGTLLWSWRLATAAPEARFLCVADAVFLVETAAPIDLKGVGGKSCEPWLPSAACRRPPVLLRVLLELVSDPQPALVDLAVPVAGHVVQWLLRRR